MEDFLAIVIPAYKKTYLREALQSIAKQTHKGFTVYIGDDCSPDDLASVVKEFESSITLVYQRFESNMGGTDLVGHWNRCIDLSHDEPWIWLFSDDDIMDSECVALFYEALNNSDEDLFHFNVKIIDENSNMTGKLQLFPQRLTVDDFFAMRITYQLSSFVVEYIFSRLAYLENKKFKKFDLAWCSDDATWIRFGHKKGIRTIEGAFVHWRFSQINISSKVNDSAIIMRKLASSEAYIMWVTEYFRQNHIKDKTENFDKLKWMLQQFLETSAMSYWEKMRVVKRMVERLHFNQIKFKAQAYLLYMEIKKRLK